MTKIFEGAGGGGSKGQTSTADNLLSDDVIEVVLGIAEGPIKGLVGDTDADKAKSVLIGDTPMADAAGNSNFEEFVMASYKGTPYDTPINFALGGATTNHSSSVSLPVTLDTDTHVTRTWSSPLRDPSKQTLVDIRIQVQQLYRSNSNGTFEETVELQVAYKASTSGTWINWDHNPTVSNFSITGKTTGGYVKELSIWLPGIATGSYEFRVTKKSPINTTEIFRTISWESFQTSLPGVAGEPTYDDPNYGGGPFPAGVENSGSFPDVALLHLKGRATDQFSSVPEFSGIYEGWKMKVPSNYNPELRTYSGTWDGTFYATPTYTNNPALFLYNLIVDERLGLARYYKNVSANRYVFYKAAQWCDTMVPDGNGGYQPRFTMNELITQPRNGLELLQYIAGAFNATLFDDENGTVHLRTDEYETPLQIFTPENTSGDFQYSYSDISTRANSITVSFVNPDLNWNEDRRIYEDDALIAENGRIPMDFIAIGCTDVHEATRRAAYRLVTANTEVTSVSFVTSRLGMLTSIFQTIYVADPDSGWSQPGRVKSIVGNVVNLRDPIFFTDTSPVTMVIQTATSILYPTTGWQGGYVLTEVTVVPPGTGLQSSFTKTAGTFPIWMPEKCVFTLKGTNFGLPKPFKVMQIEEATEGGSSFRITALEVNVNKYSDVESGVTSQSVAYSYKTPQFPLAPTNLQTRAGNGEVRRSPTTGELQYLIFVSWERVNRPYTSYYEVEWREVEGGQQPRVITTDDYCYLGPLNPDETYDVSLTAVSPVGTRSRPLSVLGTYVAKRTLPPSDVTGLTAVNPSGTIRISFDWPLDSDYHSSLIKEGDTWATATVITSIPRPLSGLDIEYFGAYGNVLYVGTFRKFWVVHVNTSGEVSPNPQSVTVNVAVQPNVTGLTAVNEDGDVRFTFDIPVNEDYFSTQIRKGASWGTGTLVAEVLPPAGVSVGSYVLSYDGTLGATQFWVSNRNSSLQFSSTPVGVSATITIPFALTSLSLTATVREVRFIDVSSTTPKPGGASIVATATLVGISGTPVFEATAYGFAGNSLGTIAMPYVSGAVTERTFTPAQFVTYAATDHVKITATLLGRSSEMFVYRLNDGATGVTAKSISITADKYFFRRDASTNAIAPSTDVITLSANKQNTLLNVTWSSSPGLTFYTAPTGGVSTTLGDTVYLRAANFAGLTAATITATIAADSISDTTSIASIRDGATGVVTSMGNPVHQLPTTAGGTVTYTGSGTTIQVLEAGTPCVITGCTAVGTGITATSPVVTGIGTTQVTSVAHSAIVGANATVKYTLVYTRPDGTSGTAYATQNLAKNIAGADGGAGAPGAPGAAAKLLVVSADSFGFRRDMNGAITPSNAVVKLTANKQNTSNTVTWATTPSVSLYNAPTAGSIVTTGDIVYLRAAEMAANTSLLVSATIAADSLSDTLGLITTRDGDLAPVVVFGNPSHPLPTNTAGTVTYTGSGTTIQVLEGGVARTITACTPAATNITAGGVSGLGTASVTIAAASAILASTASIKYTLTFTKGDGTAGTAISTQTLFKAQQGATGADSLASAIIYAYQRKATPPTLNAGAVTYDFTTKTMTAPVGDVLANGWYKTIHAGTDDLYVQAATAVATSGAPTVASVLNTDWSAPAVLASDGLNVATVLLYARNDTPGTPPAALTGTVVYTFADGSMTGVASPWAAAIPSASAGACLWVIRATAASTAATDSLAAAEFSAASLLVSSAVTLFLTATGSNFLFDDAAATTSLSPTVTFTAVLQNQPAGAVANFVATPYTSAGVALAGVTLGGGASNTRTLTAVQFLASPSTAYMVVTASLGAYSDTMTVSRVNGGTDAVSVELGNSDHSFTALANGTVSFYTGSGTTITVKEGVTPLVYDPLWAGVTAGFWKLSSVSATNITPGTLTDAGSYLSVEDHSGVAAGVDTSSITYGVTGRTSTGATFSLAPVQTFSKSKAGAVGTPGARSSIIGLYAWAFTDPGAPNGTSTNTWASVVPHTYSGDTIWSVAVPVDTTPNKKLYYVEKVVVDSTGVAAFNTVVWTGVARTVVSSNTATPSTCYSSYTGNGAVPSGSTILPLGELPPVTSFGVTWLSGFLGTQPTINTGQTLWLCDGAAPSSLSAVNATLIATGGTYTIVSPGTTNFVALGASSNVAGTTFVATGAGTGTGTAFQTTALVAASSIKGGVSYTIANVGTTNFTLIGAASNTVGLTFLANGPGTGSGNANTAVMVWGTPYLATFKVGSLSALQANLGTVDIGTDGAVRTSGISFGGTGYYAGYSAAGTYYGTVYGSAAYRFSVGNSSNYLAWDGSNLFMGGGVFDIGASGIIRGGQTAYNVGGGFWLGRVGSLHQLSIGYPGFDILSINVTTDTFTTSGNHGYVNGTKVSFSSVSHFSGVTVETEYAVMNVTSNTFQLNNGSGAVLNLVDIGGGTHLANLISKQLLWDGSKLVTSGAVIKNSTLTCGTFELTKAYGPIFRLVDTPGSETEYFSVCLQNTEALVETNVIAALGLPAAVYRYGPVFSEASLVFIGTADAAIDIRKGGVKFPATAIPSADANTLDDYQEGTWTPTLTMASGSCTLTTAAGAYTKIGNRVQLEATVVVNTVSTPSGALTLGGLPFTSMATPTGMKIPAALWAEGLGATNSAGTLMAHLPISSTSINISRLASGVRTNDVGAAVQAASVISISISYSTAS